MNAVSILEHEHEAILFGISLLEKVSAAAASGNVAARRDAPELVRFLKGFADTCHHGKEEGILFPAMEQAGVLKTGGPLGAMLDEHARGRAFIQGMKDAIATSDYAHGFAANVAGYASLLRTHIGKENSVLFPMGVDALGAARMDSMGGEFDRFEEAVMGKGEHERFHAMLDEFAERWKD